MTRRISTLSRLLTVLAVLLPMRPPCLGDDCCSKSESAVRVESAEHAPRSCCRSEGNPKPRVSAALHELDECACCVKSDAGNLPASSDSVRDRTEQRDFGSAIPTYLAWGVPSSPAGPRLDPAGPNLGKIPVYLLTSRLRN